MREVQHTEPENVVKQQQSQMSEDASLLDGKKVEVLPVGGTGAGERRGGGRGDYRCGGGLAGGLLGALQSHGGGHGTVASAWES